ncbi:helix-turn-helix domain-containing protein [Nocardia terpenica]|uniref:helix-turn-helix domain-containing protein n=1 Tax=Nocardia terpenica TaxID=455432 RepID=UPI001894FCD8|nr:helix-turn-helix domain-containing protein [Nocardia terpenica]MBF6065808.1 helix-turn-helix domain-containing protein [Nocardia terpenica]MBF6108429.1 helix-turn-helix domain-containing protein [Nocardia terpenica]MBF6115923.1 helix-turn-helix domain-containing protein [Nocardia terpenica]MBF6123053.1 helix-turn-helix domain-containing protein [Nocardia terpenica]MBF6156273.1 helix-turn-helix domain-containing protein [Nocardia terpenica]
MNRHRVVALLQPPQSPFELACAAEVFGTARPDMPARYDFRICAERPGPVETTIGYPMLVDAGLEALQEADTVVVPGWQPPGTPARPTVIEALRAAHRRGARIAAICTGAFVVAQAGLLDGRRATTHWRHTAQLAATFPEIQVDPDVLYVDLGDVATSAGTGAGIDLCLHLVRSDHGATYAARIAQNMVLPPHRDGSQLQYIPRPAPAWADESLAPLLDWATSRLDSELTIARLAEHAGLSSRTLARRFTEQLGTSPGQWLLGQRLDAARALLEQTTLPVEAIATRVGLASAVNLRRHFRAHLGTTPGAYRRTFGETR